MNGKRLTSGNVLGEALRPRCNGEERALQAYLTLPKEARSLRFVDTAGAAELIGLSRRTVQSWVEMGHIRAISIGKKHQIDLDSLHDFLRRKALR